MEFYKIQREETQNVIKLRIRTFSLELVLCVKSEAVNACLKKLNHKYSRVRFECDKNLSPNLKRTICSKS